MYTDALGRTVMTIGRSFDGQYTKTLTFYDNLGRVSVTTKPFLSTDGRLQFPANVRRSTISHYDNLGRATTVVEDLGVLDGTATTAPGNTPATDDRDHDVRRRDDDDDADRERRDAHAIRDQERPRKARVGRPTRTASCCRSATTRTGT